MVTLIVTRDDGSQYMESVPDGAVERRLEAWRRAGWKAERVEPPAAQDAR